MTPEPAPADQRSDLLVGNAAAVVMVLAWGATFPLIELLVQQWDMFSTTASRQVGGALTLFAALWISKRRFPLHRSLPWRKLIILGFMGPAFSSFFTTLAISTAGSIAVAVVFAMGPLVAALVARFCFAIPLQKGIPGGIFLACLGGIVVKSAQVGEASFTGGEGSMLLNMVFWAWYSIAAQRWLKGYSQLEIAALTILPGSLMQASLVAVLWITGLHEMHMPLNTTTISLAVFIAVIPIAVGNLMWHTGVSRLGVTMMAIFANLVPIIAILLAVWLGAEPSFHQVAGGLIVLAGVIYAQVLAARSRRTATGQ
ncbi:MAG: DMT family transporter [Alphaproteobacteria bacterium]|nr:DMT family transporter [Rhodospirillaceae bacterium]MDG2480000.1 DMT family transporter [Alphaproteobacteria bacterium]MBT6203644.1 DMT family transporter [Rhodospirillaceae bacterium]MBT6512358.1 DMT family transporter [Rhodospirillaceae bacterium]MBT7611833.1 DMT family transporter [Rhodospirillaceae bacterium]